MKNDFLYQLRFILLVLDINALAYLSWYFLVKTKEPVSKYFSLFLLGRTTDSFGILISMIFYYQSIPLWLNIKRLIESGVKATLTVLFAMYIFGLIGKNKTDNNII